MHNDDQSHPLGLVGFLNKVKLNLPNQINDFKGFIDFCEHQALDAARHFIHLDLQVRKKVGMIWDRAHDENGHFSNYAIWISIIAFTATIAFFILKLDEFRAIMQAKNCKVEVEWNRNNPNKVGGEVLVKILPFFTPQNVWLSFFLRLGGRGALDTETAPELMSNILIQVFHEDEQIISTKGIDEEDGRTIYAKFNVMKSGKYFIFLSYRGYVMKGSPFVATMEADEIDITKSYMGVSNPVIIVTNRQFKLDIIPLDIFGNRCATTLDTMQRIKFTIDHTPCDENANEIYIQDRDMNHPSFKTNVGIRREDSERKDLLPLYCIYGKCSTIGRFWGQVWIDNIALSLPFSRVELLCISADEEEMVEGLKETGEVCKWNGKLILPKAQVCSCVDEEVEDVGVVEVGLEMSTRFIFLSRKWHDGPLEVRLDTWRMGEHIKVEIVSVQNEPEKDTHIIKIGNTLFPDSFKELVLSGTDARTFLVLFHENLATEKGKTSHVKSYGGGLESAINRNNVDTLKVKQGSFYRGVRSSFDMDEFLFILPSYKTFTVTRADVIKTTLEATADFTQHDWVKPFVVSFRHESVNRSGATWLEWGEELASHFFESNSYGMFLGKNFRVGNRNQIGLLHPNSTRNKKKWPLEHYELAGKLVAKFVVENALGGNTLQKHFVDARFSRTILAMMLGIWPTWKHLQIDDPDYFRNNCVQVLQSDNVSEMGLNFVIREVNEMGELKIHPLIPSGENVAVTNANKFQYLNALAEYRLCHSVQKEINAFISGLNFILPARLLMMFDENELELILCGASPLNLSNLVQYYEESSTSNWWSPSFPKVKGWLRRALEELDPLDLGRFFQFLTGSSRLPQEGWVALRPSIGMSALFGEEPMANKVQAHLTVTDHKEYKDFKEALLRAIYRSGFD